MSDIVWQMKMKSIKRRLLIGLSTIIILSTLVSIALTYFELKEEMDELFDQNMAQIAHAIAVHSITEQSDFVSGHHDIRRTLKGEEEFLIQVWYKDHLSFSSMPALAFPNQGEGGIRTVLFNEEEWRFYALNAGDGWLVQVSQPISLRHTVIWEIYAEQLIPTLIHFPVLLGLVWLVVGCGFAPLKRISESIEQRTARFLEKLPEEDAPDEVLTMVQAINGLLDRLSVALDTQRRFTADAAHELRTPLTAVRLELDVLKRAENEDEKQQSIQKLYNAVDRSTRVVHQLLEMARLEPEQAHENMTDVSLHGIVRNIVEEMQQSAQKKEIELNFDDWDNVTIQGRFHALTVLIANLVGNAIKYTPQGGKVIVSVFKEGEQAILSVSDNGPGIAEHERLRVFDRFYRILDKNYSGITSSGLGLSIVKSIADAHNARINILDGIEGKGSTFQIIFAKPSP